MVKQVGYLVLALSLAMPLFTDQLNRTVLIASPPRRIVSLVPSQTELLYDLGLDEEVVGITKFCVHPEKWFREKSRIGGTKNIHPDRVASLNPDLIIANKEENVREQVEALANEFPVWVSDVNTVEDALVMIKGIGAITGKEKAAETITTKIKSGFSQLHIPNIKPQAAYLIWKDPYMTIGGDTFVHHMLNHAGFQNCFAHLQRYPSIDIEDLQRSHCEYLFLSSEPYPFQQKHAAALQAQLPHTKILLVDGEMFSWYGSRLLKAPGYFQTLQQQIDLMA
ncbi:MAG TPA: helical backbone metal receptor [Flavisolibacter sp.]|nr:helical backbone metal receptor [Flavisolibacter sp.]